jgi:hypothetical protein
LGKKREEISAAKKRLGFQWFLFWWRTTTTTTTTSAFLFVVVACGKTPERDAADVVSEQIEI